MIESAKFWFSQFEKINVQEGIVTSADEQMLAYDAASFLLKNAFVGGSAINVRREKQALEPEVNAQRFFNRSDIEQIAIEFEASEIEPSAIDIIAIVFETTGQIIREGASFEGLPNEQRSRLNAYRLLYPAARIALGVAVKNDLLNQKISQGIADINMIAEAQISSISDQVGSTVDAATNGAKEEIQKIGGSVIERVESEGTHMLEQKKKELVDNLILQDVMQLWDEKSQGHQTGFRAGAILFFAMIAVPILAGFANFEAVKEAVRSMLPADNALPWGSLLIFTVPALGYAWILRFVSRFTMQNLTLSDDAAQRSVMAKTFIRLVSEGKVDDEKDRAIMLNALFRPIPGAKEQDIQPPTIADFVSKQG